MEDKGDINDDEDKGEKWKTDTTTNLTSTEELEQAETSTGNSSQPSE